MSHSRQATSSSMRVLLDVKYNAMIRNLYWPHETFFSPVPRSFPSSLEHHPCISRWHSWNQVDILEFFSRSPRISSHQWFCLVKNRNRKCLPEFCLHVRSERSWLIWLRLRRLLIHQTEEQNWHFSSDEWSVIRCILKFVATPMHRFVWTTEWLVLHSQLHRLATSEWQRFRSVSTHRCVMCIAMSVCVDWVTPVSVSHCEYLSVYIAMSVWDDWVTPVAVSHCDDTSTLIALSVWDDWLEVSDRLAIGIGWCGLTGVRLQDSHQLLILNFFDIQRRFQRINFGPQYRLEYIIRIFHCDEYLVELVRTNFECSVRIGIKASDLLFHECIFRIVYIMQLVRMLCRQIYVLDVNVRKTGRRRNHNTNSVWWLQSLMNIWWWWRMMCVSAIVTDDGMMWAPAIVAALLVCFVGFFFVFFWVATVADHLACGDGIDGWRAALVAGVRASNRAGRDR